MNHPFLMMALGLSSINAAHQPQVIHRCTIETSKAPVVGLGITPNTALLAASDICLSKAGTPQHCAWEKVKCTEVEKSKASDEVVRFANAHPELAEKITMATGYACRVDRGLSSYQAQDDDEDVARLAVETECLQNDPFGEVCKPERIKCLPLASPGKKIVSAKSL